MKNRIELDQIFEAGIVGAGGAGFPTHVKLSGSADTLLINAAECEPLLHKDKELMRVEGPTFVEGVARSMQLSGAAKAIIGIKRKYESTINALQPHLGPHMEIAGLDDAYPAGDEMILVHETLGRVVPPGGIPLQVGCVVMNVETAYNVGRADITPVVDKYVSVAGAVKHPATVLVPVGTSLSECVEAVGGATIDDPYFVIGGLMMGYLEEDLSKPVDKTSGGIIVLPENNTVVRRHRMEWGQISRIGRSACDQCSFCTELCPRNLLGHPIEPHRAMRSLGFNLAGESNVAGTVFCCECGLCTFIACPEDLDPRAVCVQNKKRIMEEGRRWENPPFMPRRADRHMKNRKTPTARLIQKLGISNYENNGPMSDVTIEPDSVLIRLKQHIGAPCEPTVEVGQTVKRGDVVGRPPVKDGKPALGAPVHASINGVIDAIEDGSVRIRRTE
jgi:Na+-translocating ferredoxin:NAD+ oxidoreductase RnfC subunit